MKSFLIFSSLFAGFLSPALAAPPAAPLGQQTPNRPNDAQVLYVALIFNSDQLNDPADIELQTWFLTQPELMDLKARSRYREYRPSDKYFETLAGKHFSERPAVIIQTAPGEVVYRCYTREMQGDPRKLVDEISKSLHHRFPNMPYLFPVLRPCPTPETPPVVVPVPVYPSVVPQVRPVEPAKPAAKEENDNTLLFAVMAGAVATGLGFLVSSRRESLFPSGS